MKVIAFFKDNTDKTRTVTDFLYEFERQTGHQIEAIDPESPEGIGLCLTYDILEWPTIIALSDSGILLHSWRGLPLPTINEVSFYF